MNYHARLLSTLEVASDARQAQVFTLPVQFVSLHASPAHHRQLCKLKATTLDHDIILRRWIDVACAGVPWTESRPAAPSRRGSPSSDVRHHTLAEVLLDAIEDQERAAHRRCRSDEPGSKLMRTTPAGVRPATTWSTRPPSAARPPLPAIQQAGHRLPQQRQQIGTTAIPEEVQGICRFCLRFRPSLHRRRARSSRHEDVAVFISTGSWWRIPRPAQRRPDPGAVELIRSTTAGHEKIYMVTFAISVPTAMIPAWLPLPDPLLGVLRRPGVAAARGPGCSRRRRRSTCRLYITTIGAEAEYIARGVPAICFVRDRNGTGAVDLSISTTSRTPRRCSTWRFDQGAKVPDHREPSASSMAGPR